MIEGGAGTPGWVVSAGCGLCVQVYGEEGGLHPRPHPCGYSSVAAAACFVDDAPRAGRTLWSYRATRSPVGVEGAGGVRVLVWGGEARRIGGAVWGCKGEAAWTTSAAVAACGRGTGNSRAD